MSVTWLEFHPAFWGREGAKVNRREGAAAMSKARSPGFFIVQCAVDANGE
jgi:hypothetical protein